MSRAYDSATLAQSLLAPVARCLDAALADMGFELAAQGPLPSPDVAASERPETRGPEARSIAQLPVPVVNPNASAHAHLPDTDITAASAPESAADSARDSMPGPAHVVRLDEAAGMRPRLRLRPPSPNARVRERDRGARAATERPAISVRQDESGAAPVPAAAHAHVVGQSPHGPERGPTASPALIDRRRPEHRPAVTRPSAAVHRVPGVASTAPTVAGTNFEHVRPAASGGLPAVSPAPALVRSVHPAASTASERSGSALEGAAPAVPGAAPSAADDIPGGSMREHELAALLARSMNAAPGIHTGSRGADSNRPRVRLRPRDSAPETSDTRPEPMTPAELTAQSRIIAASSTGAVRGAQRVLAAHAMSSEMPALPAPGAALEPAAGLSAAPARTGEAVRPPPGDALPEAMPGHSMQHGRITHPHGHLRVAPWPQPALEPPAPSPAAGSASSPAAGSAPAPTHAAARIASVTSPAPPSAAWPAPAAPAATPTRDARQGAHTATAASGSDARPLMADPLDPTLERTLAAVLRSAAQRQGIDV